MATHTYFTQNMLNILCLVIGGTRFRVRAVSRPGITVVNNRLDRRVRLFASFQVFFAHGVQKADKVYKPAKWGDDESLQDESEETSTYLLL